MDGTRLVLVTGGAGYIGSHAALALLDAGWAVSVVDNLSTGYSQLVPREARFHQVDVADSAAMGRVLSEDKPVAVMHFAGSTVIPESVANPLKYYQNNTEASRRLIGLCVEHEVENFIFSSTAAVYGVPRGIPISEDQPTCPISPYGKSKLMTEWNLAEVARATGLGYAVLRYFNVAGADLAGRSGQISKAATHLIKVACETATGKRPEMSIFGNDYETPDGTCIRDYIHVSDIVSAHICTLEHMLRKSGNLILNCGYGRGASVRQVIDKVSELAGHEISVSIAARRPGDQAELIADVERIKEILGWIPRYDDLDQIIGSTLAWERRGVS